MIAYKQSVEDFTLDDRRKDRDVLRFIKQFDQPSAVQDASAVLVISAVYERTTIKYGERGIRYVHMEAGHAAENVYLQAVSLNLGTVVIGAFDDDGVKKAAHLTVREQPLYIMPVGKH